MATQFMNAHTIIDTTITTTTTTTNIKILLLLLLLLLQLLSSRSLSLQLAIAYSGLKLCRPFETFVLLVPIRNLRDFTLLNIDFKRRNCPSAGYASATNTISNDTGVFKGGSVLHNDLTDVEIFTK